MKYIVIMALLATLVACSGASNETVNAAENALKDITKARTLLATVNTIEDAQAIETDMAAAGTNYANAVQVMSTVKQGDVDTAQQLAKITPLIAAEYQGMLLELNALQSRNTDAAQVLLDELQSFKPKRR
ncbi:hypothetical protein ACOYR1_08320 [Thalassotalea piscium]